VSGLPIACAALVVCLAPRPAAAQDWAPIVDAPASLAAAADRLERVNAASLERALNQAGLTLPASVRVTLIDEADPRARATPRWIAGQAFDSGAIVIFPGRIASYPYDSIEAVLRHEVAHVALTARAGGRPLPRWFHEGVAVSIERGWGTGDTLRLLLATWRGPAISEVTALFRSGERDESAEAYRLATALVDRLRREHGAGLPGAIAARVAAGASFGAAFEAETGESPDEAAAAAWATYRTLAAWVPALTSGTSVWTFILVLSSVAFVVRLRRRRKRRWAEEDG
jgi:hypothetical protein